MKGKTNMKMRVYHRYLGFFLAGIMAVYAISGIILIFRDTDFLKVEKVEVRELPAELALEDLGKELRIRDLKVTEVKGDIAYFEGGEYNTATHTATYTKMQLPTVLDKMTHLHKATSSRPLAFLNIFFGVALLFFVVSSFWMFFPGTDIFKKGLYFSLVGLVLAIVMLFL